MYVSLLNFNIVMKSLNLQDHQAKTHNYGKGLAYLKNRAGVPVLAQWLTNPTRNHEVVGLVPALAQWVNDPALP